MRLFVAVVPPIEVVEDLSEFVEPRREHPDDDIRWAADEHWHITLAFLGDVPDWKTEELGERLERAAKRQKPFELQLTGAGAFPGVRSMSPSGSGSSTRTTVRSGPRAACNSSSPGWVRARDTVRRTPQWANGTS